MSTEQKQEKTLVPPGTGEAMVTDNAEEKQADMPPSAEDDSKKAENPKGGEGQTETVVEKSKDAGEAKKKDEGDKAAPVKEEPTEEDLKTMPVRKYLETTGMQNASGTCLVVRTGLFVDHDDCCCRCVQLLV